MVYTFTAEALNRVREKITTEIKTQLDAKKSFGEFEVTHHL